MPKYVAIVIMNEPPAHMQRLSDERENKESYWSGLYMNEKDWVGEIKATISVLL